VVAVVDVAIVVRVWWDVYVMNVVVGIEDEEEGIVDWRRDGFVVCVLDTVVVVMGWMD